MEEKIKKVCLTKGEFAIVQVFNEVIQLVKQHGGCLAKKQHHQSDNFKEIKQLIIEDGTERKMLITNFNCEHGIYIEFALDGCYYYLQTGSNVLLDTWFMKANIVNYDKMEDFVYSAYIDDLSLCFNDLVKIRYAHESLTLDDEEIKAFAKKFFDAAVNSGTSKVARGYRKNTIIYKEIN